MSNRKSRRINTLKNNDAPDESKETSTVSAASASTASLLPTEKLVAPEYYKVEDRIQQQDENAVSTDSMADGDKRQHDEVVSNADNQMASSGDDAENVKKEESGDGKSEETKQFNSSITDAEHQTTAATASDATNPNQSGVVGNNANATDNEKDDTSLLPQEAAENSNADQPTVTKNNAVAAEPVRRHRTRSTSSANSQKDNALATTSKEDNPEATTSSSLSAATTTRRVRTRSASSAMSSISGDSHQGGTVAGEDAGNNASYSHVDNGKTPRITNRRASKKRSNSTNDNTITNNNDNDVRTSKGPVRKRHKGRALFNNSNTETLVPSKEQQQQQQHQPSSLFPNDGLLLLTNESEDNLLLPRSRSNTIDSFRVTMMMESSSSLNMDQEEIMGVSNNNNDDVMILPEMKTNNASLEMVGKEVLNNHKTRSDTLDLMLRNDSLTNSPRGERSDTVIDSNGKVKTRSDTMDFLSVLTSPRGRSDTIDFLTAAVGGGGSVLASPLSPIKISADSNREHSCEGEAQIDDGTKVADSKEGEGKSERIDIGKTPKKNNLTTNNNNGEPTKKRDPIKKRYRTRSLSYNEDNTVKGGGGRKDDNDTSSSVQIHEEIDEDDIATASLGSYANDRTRSNTLESFQNALAASSSGRSRSDTIDFLMAAVAGDMGHDLDAAMAAAKADGASFSIHPISAPSGASTSHSYNGYHHSNSNQSRPRSNTLDSTTSSVNSSKLDFLVSVAVEQGAEFSLLPEERVRDHRSGSMSENSSEFQAPAQRRPRSNTLEMYSNMRGRSDSVDFLIGPGNDSHVGEIDNLPDDSTSSGNVLDHLKALCGEPAVNAATKTTGILRRGRLSSGGEASNNAHGVTSPRAKFDNESTKRTRTNPEQTHPSNSAGSSSQRLVMEALKHFETDKRDRNDSWGGMSDLSVTGITATHDALKSTGIIDDLMAAAADIGDDMDDELTEDPEEHSGRKRTGSGGTNSLSGKGRPRKDSLASLSLASLSDASISVSGRKEQYAAELVKSTPAAESKASISTPGSQSIVVDYDAITAAVNAANAATEGIDLNSLGTPSSTKPGRAAATNAKKPASKLIAPLQPKPGIRQPPKLPTPKLAMRPPPKMKPFPTKYQANPHLLQRVAPSSSSAMPSTQKVNAKGAPLTARPGFPTSAPLPGKLKPDPILSKAKPPPVPVSIDIPIPKSTKTEAEMEAIRERARAAAGYVPPPGSKIKVGPMPLPKMPPKTFHPMPSLPPGHPSGPLKKRPTGLPPGFVPGPPPPGYMARYAAQTKPSSVQSQQKWDDMFQYLVKFIEETRTEQTKDLTEEEKKAWVWDVSSTKCYHIFRSLFTSNLCNVSF